MLAEIDKDLTVEGILDTVKAYKDKTVAEAFTEIDAELAKKNTSLQGIYDAIVNAEALELILKHPAIGMPAETLAQMKAFKLDAIKTEYGAMKLGAVVNMIVEMMNSSGGADSVVPANADMGSSDTEVAEPVDYFAEAIAMVEATLATTLADLGVTMADFSTITISDLSIDTGLKLNAAGNGLETLYLSVDFGGKGGDVTYTTDEATGEEIKTLVGYEYIVLSADLTISSFSTSVITINAPAESEIEVEVDSAS